MKFIKPGLDSDQVIARFEAERQALALMDHPHIAKVFDAGITDPGRHYFVMELVHGIPITDYCNQNQLRSHPRWFPSASYPSRSDSGRRSPRRSSGPHWSGSLRGSRPTPSSRSSRRRWFRGFEPRASSSSRIRVRNGPHV
jgi:hypothetical protein